MKIQIIIGSTRPGRVGPQIADWMVDILRLDVKVEYEIVDVAAQNLPLFNEPAHPSTGQYKHNHTKAWSKKIKEADAFIFLTPEYNAGYPASLKNAIDYLYFEWSGKPVMIVSYGALGSGLSVSAQLRQVVGRLRMQPTSSSPSFAIVAEALDKDGQIKDITTAFEKYIPSLQEAREELLAIAYSSNEL